MATTTESALQVKELSPSLTVNDVPKSVTFFEALGFAVEERWEDNGVLHGVMLRAGEARIGLAQDDWKQGRERKKGVGIRLYLNTSQNIDQLAERATKAGITLDSQPHDGMGWPRLRRHGTERIQGDDRCALARGVFRVGVTRLRPRPTSQFGDVAGAAGPPPGRQARRSGKTRKLPLLYSLPSISEGVSCNTSAAR